MANDGLKEGADFSEMVAALELNIMRLSDETYAATKKKLAEDKMKNLVQRAETQLADYQGMLAKYTGGRRAAIADIEQDAETLREYTAVLQKYLKQRGTR